MKTPFDDFIYQFPPPDWIGQACLDGAISFDEGTELVYFLIGHYDMPDMVVTLPERLQAMLKVIHYWNDIQNESLH